MTSMKKTLFLTALLGTLIASMASLISFKAYANIPSAGKKEYLALFSLYNLVLLAVLILWYLAVY